MAKQQLEPQRLLIVDGDVLVRHVISDYLRSCGYVVIEAASTDEAMVVLSDRTTKVEAVLCDAQAPGTMNAFELRTREREASPEVEFILAGSVEAAAGKAADLCEQGPQLMRPYDPQGVVDYIRRISGRRSSGRLSKA